ncbi:TonB-dependent receptor [Tahibacter amnicola]|uniref:TonB-dependent receptor n=1 Tax=Tahibacter amnicola TaxID=2976241 RepID=A0ABY6BKI0_9GAMM|nr:TonB-dependent receptor [Tahibacter amnicola]UXI70519.1 TonB-dependent receptor [Tahibacter amnicola]
MLLAIPVGSGLAADGDAGAKQVRAWEIPAGPLAESLTQLAQQGNVQLLFDPALVAGRSVPALKGKWPPAKALQRLLRRSGLTARAIESDTFVISAAPAPRVSLRIERTTTDLPTVEVTEPHARVEHWTGFTSGTVITRAEIERSGAVTLSDLLRSQPGLEISRTELMASQPDATYSHGGAAGAASVGMRGLGAKSTLVLIEGRRMANYGLTQGGFGAVVDVNSIPLGLIESVEILREGASTRYGADAIGGVINLHLRHAFEGIDLSATAGTSQYGDGSHTGATAALGDTMGENRYLLYADYTRRYPLIGKQRDWYTQDKRRIGLWDQRSYHSYPGTFIPIDESGELPPNWIALPGCPQDSLNDEGVCVMDSAKYASLQTDFLSKSGSLRITREIDESVEIHADLRWTQVTQQQQARPEVRTVEISDGIPGITDLPGLLDYAFADLGPVRERTVSTSRGITFGAKGDWLGWQWTTDLSLQQNRTADRVSGVLLSTTGYNYFGPNSPEILEAMSPTIHRSGRNTQHEWVGDATRSLWDLKGGPIEVELGANARHISIYDVPSTLLNIPDNVATGLVSYPQTTTDNAAAAYAQATLPFLPRFTTELGWRIDKGRASAAASSPKVALRWTPTDTILLRGTAVDGYRPPMAIERERPEGDISIQTIRIPKNLAPCATPIFVGTTGIDCSLQVSTHSNPELAAETSRSYNVGVVYTPMTDLNLSLDLYNITRRKEIANLPVAYALLNTERFPGFTERNENGVLTGLHVYPVNFGYTKSRGLDFSGEYRFEDSALNEYTVRMDATYVLRRELLVEGDTIAERYAGYESAPKFRGRLDFDFIRAPWAATAGLVYVGPYRNYLFESDYVTCSEEQKAADKCVTPGFFTLNLNLRYAPSDHWSLALNIGNALDHEPTYYGPYSANYNVNFDDPIGRSYTLTFRYRH